MKINDINQIKQEILDCGLIPTVLEGLGCENIKHVSHRFEAQLPEQFNSTNARSVQVYENENLSSAVRSRGIKGDIFTLVAYLMTESSNIDFLNKQLYKAKNKVLSILGWNNSMFGGSSNVVHNEWLKELRERRSKEFDLSTIEPNPVLPNTVLDGFVHAPHKKWVEDDISWEVQREFGVCFDLQTERICFPIFDKDGELIGVKGRATRDRDKEDYKYMPIYSFQKGRELFNLHRALPYIKESNTVILVEAEKSVMKLYGFGQKNVVSQMGSDITKIQAEIIKRINPDVKVILAFDKDKSPSEVKQFAQVFDNRKNVYGVIDTKDFLENKDSPCDKGLEIWEELYNNHCYQIFP